MKYQNYLSSKSWKRRRNDVINKNQGVCSFCLQKRALHVHHSKYTDISGGSILGKEKHKYLTPLCPSCHKKWHHYHGKRFLSKLMIQRANRMYFIGVPVDDCIRFCFDKYLVKHMIINWKKDIKRIPRNEEDNSAIKARRKNLKPVKGWFYDKYY